MTDGQINFGVNKEINELNFNVPWGIIAAKCYGDPCLPPVLMVHGLQDNAGTFDRLMPLLPPTFYYVNIDLPGHGKSSRFPKGIYLDLMLYVFAIHRVVLQFQWTEFYYIAHSLGGQIGSYYAALYPEKVKKLVLLDTLTQLTVSPHGFLKYYREFNRKLMEMEKKISNNPPNYTYEEALNRVISKRIYPLKKEAAESLIKRSLKEVENNYYHFSTDQRLKFGVRTPVTNDQHLNIVSEIQCPVLLIITNFYLNIAENTKHSNCERQTLELFKKKKNFQIVNVEGAHDVHNNEPEVVAPHINKFLLQQKSVL